ncbi:hypothetical protein MSIMFB_02488 [Mycobacterium simulans]|uniref:EfeO-type cupredoxin-like domain-containing protein n=2 Tax=Mycobacterium simulans TaxID=627089 RepID=A0A7Z7IMK9_9MYCO|nr:hypothetical protein [Mycobacterium simulans]SOJ54997.1 hypothetical protein MSIMFB_02488 [Mycobacterium simulans]
MMRRRVLLTTWLATVISSLIACNSSPPKPSGQGLVIDVTIAAGQVQPSNARIHAKVGEQITLRVTSDVTDELHVHSVPDHKFAVAAAPNQNFQFSVEVPGSVDVELHHLRRTIATIQVNP